MFVRYFSDASARMARWDPSTFPSLLRPTASQILHAAAQKQAALMPVQD